MSNELDTGLNICQDFGITKQTKKWILIIVIIEDLINYLKISENIKQSGSVLIFNPVPKDKSIDKKLIDKWIEISIKNAKQKLIKGKELTPFLIAMK